VNIRWSYSCHNNAQWFKVYGRKIIERNKPVWKSYSKNLKFWTNFTIFLLFLPFFIFLPVLLKFNSWIYFFQYLAIVLLHFLPYWLSETVIFTIFYYMYLFYSMINIVKFGLLIFGCSKYGKYIVKLTNMASEKIFW
jgi:hypothetical protein